MDTSDRQLRLLLLTPVIAHLKDKSQKGHKFF